jgi:KH/beta-lactamase-domain protein
MATEDLLQQVKELVKQDPVLSESVSGVDFEGPKLVLYCKNLNLLAEGGEAVKELARKLHKRFMLRPDPQLLMEEGEAEKRIRELIPPEAGITAILFDRTTGEVVVEAQKPGIVIGKDGSTLRMLMREIGWAPRVVRTPPIRSDLIQGIRLSLLQNSGRKLETLQAIGRRIHRYPRARGDWLRVSLLGGAREVGRSCLLLQTPESKVMLDCGVNVASEDRAYPHLEAPELRLAELDAVIISHAHLDHVGFLPYLYRYGYEGPVYCTPPTRDLAVLLLQDYLEVGEREDKNAPFTQKEVRAFVQHCITLEWGEITDISPDLKIALYNAGHILGSSVVHLHFGEGLHNVVYTGDIKFDRTKLFLPAVTSFPRVETLIMESTYGGPDSIQLPRPEAEERFLQLVRETMEGGGKVLVPVFAVGRSQEIMMLLEEAHRRGEFEGEVYLDGMIWEATAIHALYPEYLSPSLRRLIFQDTNPFLSEIFIQVKKPEERQEIVEGKPCVILATAGMMTGGPVLEYFKNLAPDPRNTLVFVGYQSEGSLGRRIQKGWREVPLRGKDGRAEVVEVKMRVETIDGFSGHSDRNQLLNYVRRLSPKPSRVVCCHGEENRCLSLASTLHKLFRVETRAPPNLEAIRLR